MFTHNQTFKMVALFRPSGQPNYSRGRYSELDSVAWEAAHELLMKKHYILTSKLDAGLRRRPEHTTGLVEHAIRITCLDICTGFVFRAVTYETMQS